MLYHILQVLAVMYISLFYTGMSFKCLPAQKEITKPVRSTVEINCYLYGDFQQGYQLILEKDDTAIGQCSPGSCISSHSYHLQLSTNGTKMVIFRIDNLEPENAGAYYLSLKYNLDVIFNMFNRVLVLNLSVMAQEPICSMTFRINSFEIESSCRATFPSFRETSLYLIVMDNGTEINVNSSTKINSSIWQSYSVGNLEKFVTSLDALMTRLIVPIKCALAMSQESRFCQYPMFIDMIGWNIRMAEDSQIGCGSPALEVWLIIVIKNHFKTLKLCSQKPTILYPNPTHGNYFVFICGVETGGLIDIRSITKVQAMENDMCYTARVREALMQTTFNIVPGCESTTSFHRLSYSSTTANITPMLSLGTKDKDYTHFQTEIATTTSQGNNEDHPTLKGATGSGENAFDLYLKYTRPFWIVISIIILLTITTCMFLVHKPMSVNDRKNLQLQYYRYDRRGNVLAASVRRDDQVASLTADMTSHLINTLTRHVRSGLDFSQVQSVNDDDGCNGEVSRALIHRPALPPRGHPEVSHREADSHITGLHSAELEKANAFALATSKCNHVPSAGLGSERKCGSVTDVPQDSESIYHTVDDTHQDLHRGVLATNFSHNAKHVSTSPGMPGDNADLREKNHEMNHAFGQLEERHGKVANHSHGLEGKFTVVDLDQGYSVDMVEELYAKPKKKVKSTSLFSSGCLEDVVEGSSCSEPTPLESSDYAELRQSPSGQA